MRRLASLAVSSLLLAAGFVSVAAPSRAATETAVPLPMTDFRDLVVDSTHGHLFLSGGGSNGVVVRDLDGAAVTTITDEPGAWQMTLSDDSSTLYVALSAGDAISAVSTTTLTEVARYPTGVSTCPQSVAVTGGKLWFAYGCVGQTPQVGSLDPSVGAASVRTHQVAGAYGHMLRLQSSPSRPGLLVAGEPGLSPSTLRLLDVTGGAPVVTASIEPGSNLVDMAVTDDGTHVITAYGSPYQHHSYRTTDLSGDGVYGDPKAYPNAVATAGRLVAAGRYFGTPTVTVYDTDGSTIRTFDWSTPGVSGPGDSENLYQASLAFTADGSRMYAVTYDQTGGSIQLRVVLKPGGKDTPRLVLAGPGQARVDDPVILSGSLTSPELPIPQGATIQVERQGPDGVVTLPSVVPATDGTFSIGDAFPRRGSYRYRATWGGDGTHTSVSASADLSVAGTVPTLSVTTPPGPHAYGSTPGITGHLDVASSVPLALYVQPYGGARTLLRSGEVDAAGSLTAAYALTRNTVVQAVFPGDDTREPRTVSVVLQTRARAVVALASHYATSGSYRLFRKGVHPTLKVAVAPSSAGLPVRLDVQYYSSGGWRTLTTLPTRYLDSTSRTSVVLTKALPLGMRFRMRATYLVSSRNAASSSAWTYGRVTT